MKVAQKEFAIVKTDEGFRRDTQNVDQEEGIVFPVILWWLGVPVTLLVVLWLLGVL